MIKLFFGFPWRTHGIPYTKRLFLLLHMCLNPLFQRPPSADHSSVLRRAIPAALAFLFSFGFSVFSAMYDLQTAHEGIKRALPRRVENEELRCHPKKCTNWHFLEKGDDKVPACQTSKTQPSGHPKNKNETRFKARPIVWRRGFFSFIFASATAGGVIRSACGLAAGMINRNKIARRHRYNVRFWKHSQNWITSHSPEREKMLSENICVVPVRLDPYELLSQPRFPSQGFSLILLFSAEWRTMKADTPEPIGARVYFKYRYLTLLDTSVSHQKENKYQVIWLPLRRL